MPPKRQLTSLNSAAKAKKVKIEQQDFTLPDLHINQRKIAKDPTRFKIIAAGRRFGKTKLCSLIGLKAAYEGKKVWWVGPTYQVARLGWREITVLASQLPGEVIIKEGALVIEFPASGGFIAFKSADSPDNLRGEGLDLLIMDEADFIKAEVWEQILRPSLADRKGGAIFISTPRYEGGWFHKMYLKGMSGKDKDFKSYHFTSYDNPYIDPKEIDQSKDEIPSIVFRQEFLAEFVGAEGARVRQEWIKYETLPAESVYRNWKIALGVDLAISEKSSADYTAVAVIGRDEEGIVHILDIRRDRLTFAKQVEMIKTMVTKWQPNIIGVEDVGYQRVMVQTISAETNLAVKGIRSTKDKITNFLALETRYEHGQVIHSKELPAYFEQELLSFPHGTHDDTVDACRIAFEVLRQICITPSIPLPPIVTEKTDGFHTIGKKGDNLAWSIR